MIKEIAGVGVLGLLAFVSYNTLISQNTNPQIHTHTPNTLKMTTEGTPSATIKKAQQTYNYNIDVEAPKLPEIVLSPQKPQKITQKNKTKRNVGSNYSKKEDQTKEIEQKISQANLIKKIYKVQDNTSQYIPDINPITQKSEYHKYFLNPTKEEQNKKDISDILNLTNPIGVLSELFK